MTRDLSGNVGDWGLGDPELSNETYFVEIQPPTVSYTTQRSLYGISILCLHVLITCLVHNLSPQRHVFGYLLYSVSYTKTSFDKLSLMKTISLMLKFILPKILICPSTHNKKKLKNYTKSGLKANRLVLLPVYWDNFSTIYEAAPHDE